MMAVSKVHTGLGRKTRSVISLDKLLVTPTRKEEVEKVLEELGMSTMKVANKRKVETDNPTVTNKGETPDLSKPSNVDKGSKEVDFKDFILQFRELGKAIGEMKRIFDDTDERIKNNVGRDNTTDWRGVTLDESTDLAPLPKNNVRSSENIVSICENIGPEAVTVTKKVNIMKESNTSEDIVQSKKILSESKHLFPELKNLFPELKPISGTKNISSDLAESKQNKVDSKLQDLVSKPNMAVPDISVDVPEYYGVRIEPKTKYRVSPSPSLVWDDNDPSVPEGWKTKLDSNGPGKTRKKFLDPFGNVMETRTKAIQEMLRSNAYPFKEIKLMESHLNPLSKNKIYRFIQPNQNSDEVYLSEDKVDKVLDDEHIDQLKNSEEEEKSDHKIDDTESTVKDSDWLCGDSAEFLLPQGWKYRWHVVSRTSTRSGYKRSLRFLTDSGFKLKSSGEALKYMVENDFPEEDQNNLKAYVYSSRKVEKKKLDDNLKNEEITKSAKEPVDETQVEPVPESPTSRKRRMNRDWQRRRRAEKAKEMLMDERTSENIHSDKLAKVSAGTVDRIVHDSANHADNVGEDWQRTVDELESGAEMLAYLEEQTGADLIKRGNNKKIKKEIVEDDYEETDYEETHEEDQEDKLKIKQEGNDLENEMDESEEYEQTSMKLLVQTRKLKARENLPMAKRMKSEEEVIDKATEEPSESPTSKRRRLDRESYRRRRALIAKKKNSIAEVENVNRNSSAEATTNEGKVAKEAENNVENKNPDAEMETERDKLEQKRIKRNEWQRKRRAEKRLQLEEVENLEKLNEAIVDQVNENSAEDESHEVYGNEEMLVMDEDDISEDDYMPEQEVSNEGDISECEEETDDATNEEESNIEVDSVSDKMKSFLDDYIKNAGLDESIMDDSDDSEDGIDESKPSDPIISISTEAFEDLSKVYLTNPTCASASDLRKVADKNNLKVKEVNWWFLKIRKIVKPLGVIDEDNWGGVEKFLQYFKDARAKQGIITF